MEESGDDPFPHVTEGCPLLFPKLLGRHTSYLGEDKYTMPTLFKVLQHLL
jgi:hypothetical protein